MGSVDFQRQKQAVHEDHLNEPDPTTSRLGLPVVGSCRSYTRHCSSGGSTTELHQKNIRNEGLPLLGQTEAHQHALFQSASGVEWSDIEAAGAVVVVVGNH